MTQHASGSTHADTGAPAVSLTIEDGLATITLDSAATRNALGGRLNDDLASVLAQVLDAEGVRVAVIRANGPMFCPGADLGWLQPEQPGAPERIDGVLDALNPLFARLRASPVIVVAAVHGAVAGGGLGLLNVADLVIAAHSTRFNTAYTRIAATPDLGATYWLPRLAGERRALELLLLTDGFDAARAQALGLVNFVVPAASFDQDVNKLVRRLLAGPPGAFAAVKRLVYQAHDNDLATHLHHERHQLVAAAGQPEFAEGVRAFVEKREPRF
ncbi:1,2-epoxyphenylacetyl-CoA isomerase [compost metagenome]